jgi:succinate dehydrogenase/fumarate reductase cytochrome b subunit
MPLLSSHRLSGLILLVFIALHLFNHLCALWGAEAHLAVMERLRPYYRHPLVELPLLLVLGLQMVSGIRLFWRQKGQGFFLKLQRWSGLYLAFFFVIHLSAVFAGRYLLALDTNFYFGVAGLNTFPLNLFFMPYYGLAVTAFFGHLASIHAQKMRYAVLGISPRQQALGILGLGLSLALVLLYALSNGFVGFVIPEKYRLL